MPPGIRLGGPAAGRAVASDVRSGDAYVHFNRLNNNWSIGSSKVEANLSLESGRFTLASLQNKESGRQYVTSARPDEFRIQVGEMVAADHQQPGELERGQRRLEPERE